ncbi:MAG: ABC transporter ATP-binding protein [Dehalococcoidales bacterium]|nr:ABC transporter ATP-binding protein [Dehalococcoidales bacterium]
MVLLETTNLCYRYGEREILKNINLKIDRGEVLALIGPTGAGKTTLLRLIALINAPSAGKIYFDGTDMSAVSSKDRLQMRRRMAFVLQKPIVFNTSVYGNVAYGLKWRGFHKDEIHRKVIDVLEMFGIIDFKDRDAKMLSGGEVQRVALARAIAIEPELLLLDEPTANLDPVSTSKVEGLIKNVIQRHETTIIMATHDMTQGQRLADKAGVLFNGEFIQSGDWREIFGSPWNRQVADFVGVENILPGVITSNEDKIVNIASGSNSIEAISDFPAGTEVLACIRPEDVTLALSRLPSSTRNSFSGTISRIISTGQLSRVEIDCGFPVVSLISHKSAEEMGLITGSKVYAIFNTTEVHIIDRKGEKH